MHLLFIASCLSIVSILKMAAIIQGKITGESCALISESVTMILRSNSYTSSHLLTHLQCGIFKTTAIKTKALGNQMSLAELCVGTRPTPDSLKLKIITDK